MNAFRGIGTEYMVSSDEFKEFQVGYAVSFWKSNVCRNILKTK
jgi:hypothetical protein